jgi:hypothetical protein
VGVEATETETTAEMTAETETAWGEARAVATDEPVQG